MRQEEKTQVEEIQQVEDFAMPLEEDNGGILDDLRMRLISRKFLVFILATVFLPLGYLESKEWVWIVGIYLGIQGVGDWIQYIYGEKENSGEK